MPEKIDSMSLTRDQKREIALGIFNGSIFTSAQVPENDQQSLRMIFFVIMMLDDAQRAELEKRDIGVFWEYMSAALPRAINGYPTFASVRTMTKADWSDVRKMVLKMTRMAKTL